MGCHHPFLRVRIGDNLVSLTFGRKARRCKPFIGIRAHAQRKLRTVALNPATSPQQRRSVRRQLDIAGSSVRPRLLLSACEIAPSFVDG
jgi:hypothetical protein